MYLREQTKQLKIGDIVIGGNKDIIIQSMTNTKTSNIKKTVAQINKLARQGAKMVRVAVLDMEDASSIGRIIEQSQTVIVADIHYDYRLALEVIKQGVKKLRLNPANMKPDKVKTIAEQCKENNVVIRIGVNSGSFKEHNNVVEKMFNYAKENIDLLEENGFKDIVLSFKSSDVKTSVKINEYAAKTWDYPLHIGITEAGSAFAGGIKNAVGTGILLYKGIGNTIRVSLTGDPVEEVKVAREILKSLHLMDGPEIISCPTCGRIQYKMDKITRKVENYLANSNLKIKVAIMGCSVNGPGEASNADVGIAGAGRRILLFKKGEKVRLLHPSRAYRELIKEIENKKNTQ